MISQKGILMDHHVSNADSHNILISILIHVSIVIKVSTLIKVEELAFIQNRLTQQIWMLIIFITMEILMILNQTFSQKIKNNVH